MALKVSAELPVLVTSPRHKPRRWQRQAADRKEEDRSQRQKRGQHHDVASTLAESADGVARVKHWSYKDITPSATLSTTHL